MFRDLEMFSCWVFFCLCGWGLDYKRMELYLNHNQLKPHISIFYMCSLRHLAKISFNFLLLLLIHVTTSPLTSTETYKPQRREYHVPECMSCTNTLVSPLCPARLNRPYCRFPSAIQWLLGERAVFRQRECHWIHLANAKTAAAMNNWVRPKIQSVVTGSVAGEGWANRKWAHRIARTASSDWCDTP